MVLLLTNCALVEPQKHLDQIVAFFTQQKTLKWFIVLNYPKQWGRDRLSILKTSIKKFPTNIWCLWEERVIMRRETLPSIRAYPLIIPIMMYNDSHYDDNEIITLKRSAGVCKRRGETQGGVRARPPIIPWQLFCFHRSSDPPPPLSPILRPTALGPTPTPPISPFSDQLHHH